GHVVLKFFLNIDKDTQKKRLDDLASEKETSWRVTSDDWRQNAQYNTIKQAREDLMEITNKNNAPWHIIWNEDKNSGTCIILRTICEHLEKVLEEGVPKSKENKSKFPIIEMPKLADIDMNIPKNDGDYEKLLKKEREKLQKLHSIIYREKIPVVICFEGWDAAGKGGAIRRLSWALDPRGFKVNSIAAPTAEELAHHYLWRFWTKVPKDGHVSVFDRSWYGRVMVEKIEGFTSPDRCEMAYDEINEFEQELSKWGAVIMKFWVNIDSETQLERFTLRQETPEKQHKITDEDWRNRSKWTEYESAVDEMIKRTSTYYAPWVIIEGNDKKFARLKVLKTVRKELERRLGK
ncbi:MAG: phosphate--AMP phosphotransferase, partial [Anaerotignaceae bacterium]